VRLDLLYEFQPKVKPRSEPHPYGQRRAEQEIYDEAIASHMSDSSGPEAVKAFHQANGIFYDGVPNTRHVISNLHIEIAEDGLTASGRSYVTIFQAVTDFPLQPVFIGQYQDKFKKVDGKWRFAERECEPYLAGDLSRHAHEHPEPGPVKLS
jgi:hypothetical protein